MIECKEYRLSEKYRSMMKGGVWGWLGGMVLISLVFSLALLFEDERTVKQFASWASICVMLLIGAMSSFFQINSEAAAIAIDAEGIQSCASKTPTAHLRWEDINDITVHPFLPYIQLHSQTDRPPFLLSYELENMVEVMHLLQEKTREPSLPATFHKAIPRRIIALSGILFILSVFGSFLPSFFMVGGMFVFFGIINPYRQDRRLRLVVTRTEFQLHRRQWRSTTPFSTVTDVEFRPNADPTQAFYRHTVVVTLSNGKTLDVCPFGCDPFAVYRAVKTGWEQSQQTSDVRTSD